MFTSRAEITLNVGSNPRSIIAFAWWLWRFALLLIERRRQLPLIVMRYIYVVDTCARTVCKVGDRVCAAYAVSILSHLKSSLVFDRLVRLQFHMGRSSILYIFAILLHSNPKYSIDFNKTFDTRAYILVLHKLCILSFLQV